MTIDELISKLTQLRGSVHSQLAVGIDKGGKTASIESIWIGASGGIYLSNEPPRIPYEEWLKKEGEVQ